MMGSLTMITGQVAEQALAVEAVRAAHEATVETFETEHTYESAPRCLYAKNLLNSERYFLEHGAN
jgi:hypothetical protein